MSLDETLASKPQMFSHSKTSQESQVVMRHILIDGVLSPHRFAFKPQNNEEKHVRVAEKNLCAEKPESLLCSSTSTGLSFAFQCQI